MEPTGPPLIWITDTSHESAGTLLTRLNRTQPNLAIALCNGNRFTPDSEAVRVFREITRKEAGRGVQVYELNGDCTQLVPSLARVLKSPVVSLWKAENCDCDPDALETVRLRLEMHSILFEVLQDGDSENAVSGLNTHPA